MAIEELRQGLHQCGIRQCAKALASGRAKWLFLAEDANQDLVQDIRRMAEEKGVPIEMVPSMKELALAADIKVNTAASVLLITEERR